MKEYDSQTFRNIDYKEKLCDVSFLDCEFYSCTISDTVFEDCCFRNCKFYNCTVINIEPKYSDMLNCEFDQCMLIGIDWNSLIKKHCIGMPFSFLENSELRYNIFTKMNLKGYYFKSCNFEGSYIEDCNLENAVFQDCNFKEAQFIKNNLTKANFTTAKEYNINIYENTVKKAKFSYPEVMNLLTGIGIVIE